MATTKKPTLQDVSDACNGVHRNTISKILKGTYEGDLATISAVLDAAQKIGYESASQAPEPTAIEMPEGVSITTPDVKQSSTHKVTLKFSIEVACCWDFDKDKHGQPVAGTGVVTGTEKRNFSVCMPHAPTAVEVRRIIAQQHALLPDAV